jgi:hypothetical protein
MTLLSVIAMLALVQPILTGIGHYDGSTAAGTSLIVP